MLASSNRTPSEILTAGPALDRDATVALAKTLFPSEKLKPLDDGTLCDTAPADDEGRSVYLHAMHSVVDFFGYAIWRDGTLQRSLSLSPDSGVMEDVGDRMPFRTTCR